ncbi:MAG: integrase family protein, partial [Gallionella sp.]
MPKPAAALTDTKIKQATPSAKPTRIFDGKVTGLHLLIQPSGSKLWRLKYKFGGKEKRIAIGQYPTVSLAEVRETAAKLLFQVRQGFDPGEPTPADALIVGKKITFGEITKNYIQIAEKRKSDQRIFKIQQALNKHVLPFWGDIEIDKIKAGDVIKLLQKTEESGAYIATCIHRYIGWVFDHAVSIGEIDSIPVTNASLNHISPHRSMSVRSMDFALVPEFLADLQDYQGKPITKLAMKFILNTAIRTIELRRLRWSWLDEKNSLIKVPADQH